MKKVNMVIHYLRHQVLHKIYGHFCIIIRETYRFWESLSVEQGRNLALGAGVAVPFFLAWATNFPFINWNIDIPERLIIVIIPLFAFNYLDTIIKDKIENYCSNNLVGFISGTLSLVIAVGFALYSPKVKGLVGMLIIAIIYAYFVGWKSLVVEEKSKLSSRYSDKDLTQYTLRDWVNIIDRYLPIVLGAYLIFVFLGVIILICIGILYSIGVF
jgi:hypothetical protein